ncbi:MAG: response regulator transcription factor [Prevotellaceae bacterium]|jgi:two-component system alkaline phosphatase synthesis response regulator PhoP|nr:response regulator transcription factor [Prevotellaceae bacterium]
MSTYKILLVDDEKDILEFLSYNLKKEGFEIYTASNGKEALKIAMEIIPHLILLDVMMPDMDGVETCENIRKNKDLDNTIVAFLTARSEDYSQIAGFDAGGDDYIAKPIKPKVLISRIKALLKRAGWRNEAVETLGVERKIVIDRERFVVIKNGEEINLPRKEFELLFLLASKLQKVFTRDEIYSSVWGSEVVVGDRTIDVHIRKLREKIGGEHIKTLKGVGYKFVE